MTYLSEDGRANEHEDQRVIDGSLGQSGDLGDREFRASVWRDLSAPNLAHPNVRSMHQGKDKPIWHCSLSLKAGDAVPSDAQWSTITRDFMKGMGFPDDSRWVVVGHGLSTAGNAHVHIAANLVTESGARVNPMYDFNRAQRECMRLEHKYGLAVLQSRLDGTSMPGLSPAEVRVQREGRVPDRLVLRDRVRAALGVSSSEQQFVAALHESGTRVRVVQREGRVVGYAVALPGDGRLWFAGNGLGHDLTIDSLRRDWHRGVKVSPHQWLNPGARVTASVPTPTPVQVTGELTRLQAKAPTLDRRGLADASHQLSGALAAAGNLPASREAAQLAGTRHRPGHGKRMALGAGVLLLGTFDQDGSPNQVAMMRTLMQTWAAVQSAHQAMRPDHRTEGVGAVMATEQQVLTPRQRRQQEAQARLDERAARRGPDTRDRTMWDARSIAAYRIEADIRQHPEAFKEHAPVQTVGPLQAERIEALSRELYGHEGMKAEYVDSLDVSRVTALERQLEHGLGMEKVAAVDARLNPAATAVAVPDLPVQATVGDREQVTAQQSATAEWEARPAVGGPGIPDSRDHDVRMKPAEKWVTGSQDMSPAQRGKLIGAGYKPGEIVGVNKANASLLIDGKITAGEAVEASLRARQQAPQSASTAGQTPERRNPNLDRQQQQGRTQGRSA